jgi:hypothetical protein
LQATGSFDTWSVASSNEAQTEITFLAFLTGFAGGLVAAISGSRARKGIIFLIIAILCLVKFRDS